AAPRNAGTSPPSRATPATTPCWRCRASTNSSAAIPPISNHRVRSRAEARCSRHGRRASGRFRLAASSPIVDILADGTGVDLGVYAYRLYVGVSQVGCYAPEVLRLSVIPRTRAVA